MSWSGGGAMNYQLQPHFKKSKNKALADYSGAISELRTGYDEAKGYQRPWYDYGQNVLSEFQTWRKDPNAVTSDPSYQWRLNQGVNALENSAAARGGLLSGNTARAVTDYAQNAASQEYSNQFNRWLQQMGIGQTAANNMSSLSAGGSNAIANMMRHRGDQEFNMTMRSAQEIRAAEELFNNILQSWMPSTFGGGSPTTKQGEMPAAGSGGTGTGNYSNWMDSGTGSGMSYNLG